MPPLPTRRDLAAELLGLPLDADAHAARVAFARQLTEANGHPSALLDEAFRALTETAAACPELDRLWHEQLRQRVRAFASDYWNMPPAERRQRWEELRPASLVAPEVAKYLAHLRAGLDWDPANAPKEPLAELMCRNVCEVYVLPPGARAIRLDEVLVFCGGEPQPWSTAVRQLRRDYPELAKLAPEVLDAQRVGRQRTKALRHAKRRLAKWPREVRARPWHAIDLFVGGITILAICAVVFGGGMALLIAFGWLPADSKQQWERANRPALRVPGQASRPTAPALPPVSRRLN